MNERIKELVQHAVLAVDIVTGNEALDDELAKMYIPDCFAEKFAELIVAECLDQCYNRGMNDELYAGQLNAAWYIEQHFGVEE
jgi:hypothetical protein